MDEVDSILSQRREGEQESTIRIKNEVLVQMDGAGAGDDRLLVVGATNRPQELDDAARRRLQKRLLIPLPDEVARRQMVETGLRGIEGNGGHHLGPAELSVVVAKTAGYSGSDMAGLCREAAMEPLRDEGVAAALMDAKRNHDTSSIVRPVTLKDFDAALCQVRPSVSDKELRGFEEWNHQFGSFANPESKRHALGQ